MHKESTRYLLLIGLSALTLVMPWWLLANTEILGLAGSLILGASIPLLLIRSAWKKSRNWSGIAALLMIPYSVIGIMEVVATLGALNSGMALAVVSIANFFTALDAGRRSG
jgi:hypothetical protein